MHPNDVWRNIGDRIGVYSYETAADIPATAGVYGWFLPLWEYHNDIEDFLSLVATIQNYDYAGGGVPERAVRATFTWESIELKLTRRLPRRLTSQMKAAWARLQENSDARESFQVPLMLGSLLLPPLYVGKTKNLARRYVEHTASVPSGRYSGFAQRFDAYVSSLDINLQVEDLLFLTISTHGLVQDEALSDEYTTLIESVLMRLSRPRFSQR
jgi:hypothetical protein